MFSSTGGAEPGMSGCSGPERTPQARAISEEARREIAQSDERTRMILDAALDGVIAIDQYGVISYVNPATEETFGYSADEMVGRYLADVVVPPSLRDAHRAGFLHHLETGEVRVLARRLELTAMRRDGTEFPVELTITRVDLPDGPSFTGYLRDITERQTAERSLREAHSRLEMLAAEQAALRRVATLVASGARPRDVFESVCEETGRLLGATSVNLSRFTPDGYNLTVAGWSVNNNHVPAGTRLPLDGETINGIIQHTQKPATADSCEAVDGALATLVRRLGLRTLVGAPVIVEGTAWGALIAGSDGSAPLPTGTETRLSDFTELLATAIANAESRDALASSRLRIVAAADETRRRIERDLHDGTQQHLVSLVLGLRAAQMGVPSELTQLNGELSSIVDALVSVQAELREISHGIHPAILSEGGLARALRTLARRSAVPVVLDVVDTRVPEPVEVAAYYVVSEALTNTAKHANASQVTVDVTIVADSLSVLVSDDGEGGADPTAGSGLVGLMDRVEALGGTIAFQSLSGGGTRLHARIPVGAELNGP
jgi:PAS domain S-box-containing protein